MEFRVLGPLEVHDRERPLELRGRKQRALLAIFLLHAREWLSADALIEALWGEDSPRTAQFALRNYVAQLRHALGNEVIISRDGGYQLEVEPEQIDVARFERLLTEARTAQSEERVAKLQEALELWRGACLADLVYEPFAGREAARLEELHVSAIEELIDAELLAGKGPELVGRLEALVAEHPYRERLRGQLMLALYRGGRQVEALESYRQARETLVDELGIEPGDALRELEQAILRHDASLQPQSLTEQPPFAERRKTVTALFVELAFPERLDPELMRARSAQALGRARAVLTGHGAAVEQRAGEELMAIFGLPLAHEDDALRAGRAALELEENELRIALETGEVLAGTDEAGHGFVTGAAVAAARHLLERAAPGEVLIGETALALLGKAALSEPSPGRVEACLVGLAEQESGKARPDTPLAGRRDELAALHAAFSNVVEERRARLVLLLGEAGIGKTRLAAELASQVDGKATIARSRCLSYGRALTYWPLIEALRSLGTPAEAALDRLLAGGTTSVDQLAAVISEPLEQIARRRPLVVLFEDVHWAEPPLLELLELLTELSPNAPILFLCLARPELLERQRDWAAVETVELGPLPRPDGESLLLALAEPLDPTQRERVLERGEGNPLFLEELSAFVVAGAGDAELPPRIQVLLQARIDQLPEADRLVLTTAAIEGIVFHRRALEALLPELRELSSRLAALTRTFLIRPAVAELAGEQAYRFRHQLIRDAAYAELPKRKRVRLHEHFANWLEDHSGARVELNEIRAYHLEQAALTRRELGERDPGLDERAATALAGAAARAHTRGVDRLAAANLWRRTLALLAEADPRRPELELALALALTPLAEFREAREVLDDAERHVVDASLAAQIRIAHLHVRLYHDPEGVPEAIRRECTGAMPLFEQRGDYGALAHAWFTLAEAEWFQLQIDAASQAFERSAEHALRAGDPARAMFALEVRAVIRSATVASYSATVEEAERVVRQFPDEPIIQYCRDLARSFLAYDDGRVEEARQLARSGVAGIRRWSYRVIAASCNGGIPPVLELLNGEVEEAERLILLAIHEFEELEERNYLSKAKANLASVRLAQGRFQEALDLADAARRLAGTADLLTGIHASAARARAHLGLGDIDQATAAATEGMTLAEEATGAPDLQAHAQLARAEVLAAAGELPAALEAAHEAARIWTRLDRKLAGARATGLIEQIEHELTATGAPV